MLTFVRLVRGPSLIDRVVALELIASLVAGIVAVFAIGTDDPALIDVAIAVALVAFLGAVAFVRYAERALRLMSDLVATIAVVLGTLLGVLSAVGLLRMPDVYIRLQVASKASSLGVALLMLGVAVHFNELSVTVRAVLVVVFLFLTSPVAAHVIGRAAYMTGVPLAPGSLTDELAGAYDRHSGRLPAPSRTRHRPSGRPRGLTRLRPRRCRRGGRCWPRPSGAPGRRSVG